MSISISGYGDMMDNVDDFEILADMIRLCDYYGIQKPVPLISHKISTTKLNMTNLLSCKRACQVLKNLVKFTLLAQNLEDRCSTFARANLASWQSLVTFITNSTDLTTLNQVFSSFWGENVNLRLVIFIRFTTLKFLHHYQ